MLARHTYVRPALVPHIRSFTKPSPTVAQAVAKPGDFVSVDYTGTLDDGSVFDSSRQAGRQPLDFQIGGGKVNV